MNVTTLPTEQALRAFEQTVAGLIRADEVRTLSNRERKRAGLPRLPNEVCVQARRGKVWCRMPIPKTLFPINGQPGSVAVVADMLDRGLRHFEEKERDRAAKPITVGLFVSPKHDA